MAYSDQEVLDFVKSRGWLDSSGKVSGDAASAGVYDAAKQYGVSADQLDRALGYKSGDVSGYIAAKGWEALPPQPAPAPVNPAPVSPPPTTTPVTTRDVGTGIIDKYVPSTQYIQSIVNDAYRNAMQSYAPPQTPPQAPQQQAPQFDPTQYMNSVAAMVKSMAPTQAPPPVVQMQAPAPVQFTPQQVNPSQTTQGIISELLKEGSPVLDRAKALALEQMTGRGLTSSSIAAGAGVGALLDAATNIGSRDAGIYADQAMANQRTQYDVLTGNANRETAANQFNAAAGNQSNMAAFNAATQQNNALIGAALDAASLPYKTQAQMAINQQASDLDMRKTAFMSDMNMRTMFAQHGMSMERDAASFGYDAQKAAQYFNNQTELTRLQGQISADNAERLARVNGEVGRSAAGSSALVNAVREISAQWEAIKNDPDLPADLKQQLYIDKQNELAERFDLISAVYGTKLPADYLAG